MATYRVIQFSGSLIQRTVMLEAPDHVRATLDAMRMNSRDRLEVWLGETRVAVLPPTRANAGTP